MPSAAFDDDEPDEPGVWALLGASLVALVVLAVDRLRALWRRQ